MPTTKDKIMIAILTFIYISLVAGDMTVDYQECKAQGFEGMASDNFTSCKDMLGRYKYDKDNKGE